MRLDWCMRDTLRDAGGDEKEVFLAVIKAIDVFLAQSDKDKDRKVLASLPLLPVRLCVPHPLAHRARAAAYAPCP
jgi:hypothetical protein